MQITNELERVHNELKAENESLKTENVQLSRVKTKNAQLQLEIQHLKVSCCILFTFGIVIEFILVNFAFCGFFLCYL